MKRIIEEDGEDLMIQDSTFTSVRPTSFGNIFYTKNLVMLFVNDNAHDTMNGIRLRGWTKILFSF